MELTPIRAPQELSVVPDRVWTPAEWDVIRAGHWSTDMDDRWHAVVHDHRVHFYRSWTGNGISECQFEQHPDGWRITSVVVESDPERYRRESDDVEAERVAQLIDAVLVKGG